MLASYAKLSMLPALPVPYLASSIASNKPVWVTGQLIRGWDESFSQMSVGERRQIVLPPRVAYGDRGASGIIPGGAALYFDVELLSMVLVRMSYSKCKAKTYSSASAR
jgi:hypothetical protein